MTVFRMRSLTLTLTAVPFLLACAPRTARGRERPSLLKAPFGSAEARAGQEAWAEHLGQPVVVTNSLGMKLQLIPPGEFLMGSPDSDDERRNNERPQGRVRITKPYYLGAHEVTVGQFRAFVHATGYQTQAEREGWGGHAATLFQMFGPNRVPRDALEARNRAANADLDLSAIAEVDRHEARGQVTKGASWRHSGIRQAFDHPVVNVTWNDAVAFCEWLSEEEGRQYRLPTEAEWEYACRAGTTTRYYHGDDPEGLVAVGNVADKTALSTLPNLPGPNLAGEDGYVFTAPVGSFRPNNFGLFDTHGNVWEWCADWYDYAYYDNLPADDPRGPDSGSRRVLRGGSFIGRPHTARSADRWGNTPGFRTMNLGFRVVLVPAE